MVLLTLLGLSQYLHFGIIRAESNGAFIDRYAWREDRAPILLESLPLDSRARARPIMWTSNPRANRLAVLWSASKPNEGLLFIMQSRPLKILASATASLNGLTSMTWSSPTELLVLKRNRRWEQLRFREAEGWSPRSTDATGSQRPPNLMEFSQYWKLYGRLYSNGTDLSLLPDREGIRRRDYWLDGTLVCRKDLLDVAVIGKEYLWWSRGKALTKIAILRPSNVPSRHVTFLGDHLVVMGGLSTNEALECFTFPRTREWVLPGTACMDLESEGGFYEREGLDQE
ncbi:MAG TPA: hypothetical protein VK171_15175 [Fimbriimonas sp.]|nr:hypothetical protein [Fimbriimonas sp.]